MKAADHVYRSSLPLLATVILSLMLAALAKFFLPAAIAQSTNGSATTSAVLHITGTSVVADGHSFGRAGPYEKIVGTIDFQLDPSDPHNAVITDIQNAPRNAQGMVEYSTEFYLLRPVNPQGWNHKLLYEVNNRGNKLILAAMNDASTNLNDPTTVADFGNGFLLKRGYAILWAGWEGDALPATGLLTIRVPTAVQPDGSPITGQIAVDYSEPLDFASDGSTKCMPLSGSAGFYSYPAVVSEMSNAQLYVRESDSPRPPAVPIPQGTLVPKSQWSFQSPTEICLEGGFKSGMVYELDYVAENPLVLGIGYAATRDVVSFFRYFDKDSAGTPNPLATDGGVKYALGWGASQSGAYLRDYLYQGFNEDLSGRKVFDGVDIDVGAAFLGQGENYRFGQLNPWSDQHRARIYPSVTFPFNFGVRENPLVVQGIVQGPRFDGILKRPNTDPLVIQVDSSSEYWWGAEALETTDGFGHDVPLPANARKYLIAGTEHFVIAGSQPTFGSDNECQQLSNPVTRWPAVRALFVALDQWVSEKIPPPPSLYPTVAGGTLVPNPTDRKGVGFPEIPGVEYDGFYNETGEKDFGPGVVNNGGVITNWHPSFFNTYQVLVPKVDKIGIDLGGVRVPQVGVPIATLTGWNLRRAGFAEGDICGLNGMYLPLPATDQDAAAAGDPRPSLQSLYGTHGGYVAAMAAYVTQQVLQRYLLPEDAAQAIKDAAQSDILRSNVPGQQ
jgi:hypothetical protein